MQLGHSGMIHGRWSSSHGREENGHTTRPRAIEMLGREMWEKGTFQSLRPGKWDVGKCHPSPLIVEGGKQESTLTATGWRHVVNLKTIIRKQCHRNLRYYNQSHKKGFLGFGQASELPLSQSPMIKFLNLSNIKYRPYISHIDIFHTFWLSIFFLFFTLWAVPIRRLKGRCQAEA